MSDHAKAHDVDAITHEKLEKLPKNALDYAKSQGIGDVLFAVHADRFVDGSYGLIYLFVTQYALHILAAKDARNKPMILGKGPDKKLKKKMAKMDKGHFGGREPGGKGKGASGPQPADLDVDLQVQSFTSYPLNTFEKIATHDMVSGGLLALEKSDKEGVALCCYTNRRRGILSRFCQLITKIKEGKELEQKDFEDRDRKKKCPKCDQPYPDEMRDICPNCLDRRKIIFRLLSYFPRYKWMIVALFVLMISSSAFNLVSPVLSGRVLYDEVLRHGGKYYGQLWLLVGAVLLTKLISMLLRILLGRLNSRLASEVAYDLRMQIFTNMQRLSLAFFSNQQTGRLMNRVSSDPYEIEYFFHDGAPQILISALTFIGVLVVSLLTNWQLTLICIIPLVGLVVYFRIVNPRFSRLYKKRYQKASALNNVINDALKGSRVVRAFGREKQEVNRFDKVNQSVLATDLQLGIVNATSRPIYSIIIEFTGILVWFLGGATVLQNKHFTYGELVTFTALFAMLIEPVAFMSNVAVWWNNCVNASQRMFEVIDATSTVPPPAQPVALTQIQGEVVFDDVTFSYLPGKPTLSDINLKVEAGKILGIVGKSGAGKTTLINLMQRLYDVDRGSVKIDGVDVRDIRPEDLKGQIGVVSQETFIFSGTVADNIAYANPLCSRKDIITAAMTAGAHEFIMRLPSGYDTMIGSTGALSGGERQRLSIARAILHNPKILIFDEATASVDTATERTIQLALEKLAKGRTVISIAHRLSTLRNAHSLIVIDEGKLAESGTHIELIKQKGIYFKLLEEQSKNLRIKGVENLGEDR